MNRELNLLYPRDPKRGCVLLIQTVAWHVFLIGRSVVAILNQLVLGTVEGRVKLAMPC